MPYKIVKRDDKWAIVNKDRNETVGHSDSKEDAEASIRARLAGEHGVKFTDSDVSSFAEQFNLSYSDSYRLFELDSGNLLTEGVIGYDKGSDDIEWITVNGKHIPIKGGKGITEGGEVIDDKKGIGRVKRISSDRLATVEWEDGSTSVKAVPTLQGYGNK